MHITLLATDVQASVLEELDTASARARAYTAYGHQEHGGSALGFNGQRSERHGHYLLGNGYRGYSPSLRRFLSADRLSPFGQGGLNAYTYCQGDPVNRVDPNGAFSVALFGVIESVLGMVGTLSGGGALSFYGAVSVASGVVGVGAAVGAQVVADSNVALGLSWASFAAGTGSLLAGGGSLFRPRQFEGAKLSYTPAKWGPRIGLLGRQQQGARGSLSSLDGTPPSSPDISVSGSPPRSSVNSGYLAPPPSRNNSVSGRPSSSRRNSHSSSPDTEYYSTDSASESGSDGAVSRSIDDVRQGYLNNPRSGRYRRDVRVPDR